MKNLIVVNENRRTKLENFSSITRKCQMFCVRDSSKGSLSSPAISERIGKMQEAGIIEGYHCQVNMEALGYQLGVYISIKIRFGLVQKFMEYIKTVPEVASAIN